MVYYEKGLGLEAIVIARRWAAALGRDIEIFALEKEEHGW